MRLKVYCDHAYVEEKRYILSTLFRFLNVDIEFQVAEDLEDYILMYGDATIRVNDGFFASQGETVFVKTTNIPRGVIRLSSCKWFHNLLFLYGENRFEVTDKTIYCGGDIFGSAFFMLTRWEELVLPKDKFGRCDEKEMFVVKHGIQERPIVNEYVYLLKKMLEYIGYPLPNSPQKFTVRLTHDIDYLFRYDVKNVCVNLVGDILHRKSFGAFIRTLANYVRFKIGKIKDPFDTFDWFMDLSESCGLLDEFYFKAAIAGEYDCTYDVRDKRVKNIMKHIVERGHVIGFHPSKNTFHNPEQFKKEIGRLRSLGFGIKGGRQHFLLYELPETLRTWTENDLSYDAGLGFYAHVGFRCGCCYEYPFWDVIKRQELPILIRPMVVMEGALFQQIMDVEILTERICQLLDSVRKYQGEFVFLWHNDNLGREQFKHLKPVYTNVINYIKGTIA